MSKVLEVIVLTGSADSWAELIKKFKYSQQHADTTHLLINFSRVNFLEPRHIVSLACLIEEYFQNDISVEFVPGKYGLDKYLNNIRFYEYWQPEFDRNAYTETKIQTTLCLWHISKPMIYSYANAAHAYFQNLFPGKNLEALHISLAEIFNNIYDHANTQYDGYVLTQFYPNIEVIKISVCDFGVGIPHKINELWTKRSRITLGDADAIRAAFKDKVSSKSTPQNRGRGLATLRALVQGLNGRIEVTSNKAVLIAHGRNNPITTYESGKHFSGTLLDIHFKTSELSEEETINELDEFTFL